LPVVVPVEVRGQGPDGVSVKEEARATQVNAQGALLRMKTYPEVGSRVELVNFLAADAAQARVLEMRRSKEVAVLGMAVELVVPSETFWGVSFQLKKTNAELFKLEQVLRSGGIDLRLLKEFHDAVDYVRTAAGAFEELRECQLQGQDTDKVLLRLTAERIRRTTYLCSELAADLDACEVTHETKGIPELYQAVERIYLRLKSILTDRENQRELAARR
jgi:hypothetical protein